MQNRKPSRSRKARGVWEGVRRDLKMMPVAEGRIGGESPLFAERWIYQASNVEIAGIPCPVLITQLGGARVKEGDGTRWRMTTLPSQSILCPPNTPTHWHYTGVVDDVVFYFLSPDAGIQQQLTHLVCREGVPLAFADALVAAAGGQLIKELGSDQGADNGYMERLAGLMLEQAFRALTTTPGSIRPNHTQYARLQRVLQHIHAHLANPLNNTHLAAIAEVSEAHFRRIFLDAMGAPPHRYIQGRRLAQARKLLANSDLPIAAIATECGFSGQSHLTKCFQAVHAVTPAVYRRQTR